MECRRQDTGWRVSNIEHPMLNVQVLWWGTVATLHNWLTYDIRGTRIPPHDWIPAFAEMTSIQDDIRHANDEGRGMISNP